MQALPSTVALRSGAVNGGRKITLAFTAALISHRTVAESSL